MQPVATIQVPTMRQPLYRRRWVGALGAAALSLLLVVLLAPRAYVAWWRAHNPAPLGRSVRAIDSVLARALPVGTPRDSVTAFLSRHASDFSADSGAAGHAIVAMVRDIDTDGIISTSVRIHLAFDPAWRLTSRTTKALYTGP
jgi:hypothetical protein